MSETIYEKTITSDDLNGTERPKTYNEVIDDNKRQLKDARARILQLEETIRGLLAWKEQAAKTKALDGYWNVAVSLLPESQKANDAGRGA